MSKLDEHGLLTDETILGIDDGLCHDTIFLDKLVDWEAEKYAIKKYLTDQRDALLELVSQWLEEADAEDHYAPFYVEKQIAKLKSNPQTKAPSG